MAFTVTKVSPVERWTRDGENRAAFWLKATEPQHFLWSRWEKERTFRFNREFIRVSDYNASVDVKAGAIVSLRVAARDGVYHLEFEGRRNAPRPFRGTRTLVVIPSKEVAEMIFAALRDVGLPLADDGPSS